MQVMSYYWAPFYYHGDCRRLRFLFDGPIRKRRTGTLRFPPFNSLPRGLLNMVLQGGFHHIRVVVSQQLNAIGVRDTVARRLKKGLG